MSLSVSSWFLGQSQRKISSPRRYFLMAGCDWSDQVLRWPALAYRADTIHLGTTSITLSNIERGFRFLVESPGMLTTSCELGLGFTHPASGEERVSLYLGQPAHVEFAENGTRVRLQLQGKTRALTDVALGTAVESEGVDFTRSAYYPADLAWYLITSHGGMSAQQDAGNPDLDYGQWLAWRDVNTIRDDRVRAYPRGEKIYAVLNDLAYMNGMTVTFQDAKLRFQPVFDAFSADPLGFDADSILELSLSVDPARILNRFAVEAGYNPATGRFLTGISKVNSASEARYGTRAGRFGKSAVWFDTANDARYLAEDVVRFYHEPIPGLSLKTALAGGIQRTVADVVSVTDSFFGIAAEPFRITQMRIDMEEGTIGFELETARRRPWQYEATVSSYNAQPRTLCQVGSGVLMALDEESYGKRVLRSDSSGYFQALALYATALLPLNATEVLFGGPPSSGSLQSVLQRSSDAGSSAVIVHTLTSGIQTVYDLFEVRSGTCLASTTSGGILRSTNAGSSWSQTWTISGGYYVSRFFAPSSGYVWGATGYHAPQANGLYIWESQNDGATWALRHTPVQSGGGQLIANGFHWLSDSEHLLAAQDNLMSGLRIFRSRWSSPTSIQWIAVHTLASFAHVLATASGDLLFGFDQELTLNGGTIFRSLDQGSSWTEDARIAKRGNIHLIDRGEGVVDAYLARTSAGRRTDRYRNQDIGDHE